MNLSLIKDLDILQGYHLLLLYNSFIFFIFVQEIPFIANTESIFAPFFEIQKYFRITHLSRFSNFLPCPNFYVQFKVKNNLFPSNLTSLTNCCFGPIIFFFFVKLAIQGYILQFEENISEHNINPLFPVVQLSITIMSYLCICHLKNE